MNARSGHASPAILVAALALAALLAGCATRPGNPGNVPAAKRDPLAPANRQVYRFNHLLDSAVLRPAAKGYVKVTPHPVRSGITNFFHNLEMPVTIVNDLLQLKPLDAVRDTGRFFTNSTAGLAGFLDPASNWGMPPHSEDFGITLARWGVPSGPYLQIPFLGPSDVRDAFGLYVDHFASAFYWTGWSAGTRNAIYALNAVQLRAQFLSLDQLLEQAYDPYAFMRSAYFQNRDQTVRQNLPNYNPEQLPDYQQMLGPDPNGGGDRP
ncbi:MAG TPA: VacJ family lipoprotein [Gammaproteobacteria bacterium]|nr:VacJ family lipoprotein [Gammaproteobacteria bacterium]